MGTQALVAGGIGGPGAEIRTQGARRRRARGDRGAGTVLALAVVLATLVLGATVVAVTVRVETGIAAQHAADAAALAGAHKAREELVLGRHVAEGACSAAASSAAAAGGRVERCAVRGAIVTVEVSAQRGGVSVARVAVAGPGS